MKEIDYIHGSKKLGNIFRSLKFDIQFWRDNPDYFEPDGIWLFCGCQGSGKTLSAVQTVQKLAHEYPKALIVSNLSISGVDQDIIPFKKYEQIENTTNGIYGVIFLIDEIPVLWNSLESRDIPVSEMACFCQMRKDRRIIICTGQVYSRVAKPIREQLKYVIKCRNVMKYIQINDIINPNVDGYSGEKDGELEGEHIATAVWFHSPENYKSYDTLTKIQRIERSPKKGVKKFG